MLTTKARIMAIAPRLAPELVGETSRVMIQAKIEKASKEARVSRLTWKRWKPKHTNAQRLTANFGWRPQGGNMDGTEKARALIEQAERRRLRLAYDSGLLTMTRAAPCYCRGTITGHHERRRGSGSGTFR